jgi:hypothetical protein
MANLRLLVCLCSILALFSCHPAPKGQLLKLPSGKEIRIVQSGTTYFSADRAGWILKYETKTPISNVAELRREALEVWAQYQSGVESDGSSSAILSANEPMPRTFLSRPSGYNFVVEKQPDGTWKMRE